MAFTLNEAVVKIKAEGLDKLQQDLKTVGTSLTKIGTGTAAKGLDVDFKKAAGAAEELDTAVEKLTDSTKDMVRVIKAADGKFRTANGRFVKTADVVEDASGAFYVLGKKADEATQKVGGVGKSFDNTRKRGVNLGQSMGALGNLLSVVPGQGAVGFSTLSGSIGTATSAMGGLGLAVAGATAGIAALVGAGVGLVAAVTNAGALEKRLAEVATISKDVANNIKGFSQEIGRLSVATRTDTSLLAEGLYQTISSGITDTSDAFKVLETSANAARAGLTSVDVAVDAVTSAINAYGLEASDANRISDAYFKTVEQGKLRFEDIGRSIGKVAPLASQLGVGLEELLAAGAALTLTGKSLSESFTGVRGAMVAILKPSSEAADLAAELGIDFSAAALKTKGFEGFLKDLAVQTGNDVEILGKLFGEVEGLQAVLSLTGNQAETFSRSLKSIENAAGATNAAIEIQNNTFASQVALLKTQLSLVLQTIGEELLPSVTEALEDMNAALMGVDWDDFQSDAETAVSGIVSAFKVLGTVIGDTATLVKGVFDIVDFLLIPGGGVPESVQQGASNLGRALTIGATNQDTEFLTSAGLGPASQGNRVPLVTPTGQTFVPGSAAAPQTAAPQATGLGRAIRLSKEDQALADSFLSIGANEAPSVRTPFLQPRDVRPGRTGAQFTPRQAGTGVEATTRTPIPGVTGELIDPSTAIVFQDAAQTFADALEPLSVLADTTAPPDLGVGQQVVDQLNEEERQRLRQPDFVPGGFGTQQQDFGVTPGGQNISPLLEEAGTQLADNFSLVGAAIQGGSAGGLPGALIAVGAEILQMTEGFGRIQESWNMLVGRLVQLLEPLIGVVADALLPVFEALGSVLKALAPVFELLGFLLERAIAPPLRLIATLLNGLAFVIRKVSDFFIDAINFVIRLINRLPFVDIQEIGGQRQREGVPNREGVGVGREDRLGGRSPAGSVVGAESERSTETSGGLRVSSITGASRDILVEALRPLRQLNTTFPAMLDVLEDIRDGLGGVARQPAFALPNAPNLQGVLPQRQEADGLAAGGQFGQQGGVVIENLNINVDQVADVGDVDQLQRRLAENLDLRQRNEGVVFPANR